MLNQEKNLKGMEHLSKDMNGNLPLSLNKKVCNQCIHPILAYGSEYFTKQHEWKPKSTLKGMEEEMLCVTWKHRKQTTRIKQQTKGEDVLMTIKKKWTCAVHIMRRTDNRWTNRVTVKTEKLEEKPWQVKNQVER